MAGEKQAGLGPFGGGSSPAISGAVYGSTMVDRGNTITAQRTMTQMEMFPTSELLIKVSNAVNGKIVTIAFGEGYRAKTWVVTEEAKLHEIIAAAIADLHLESVK